MNYAQKMAFSHIQDQAEVAAEGSDFITSFRLFLLLASMCESEGQFLDLEQLALANLEDAFVEEKYTKVAPATDLGDAPPQTELTHINEDKIWEFINWYNSYYTKKINNPYINSAILDKLTALKIHKDELYVFCNDNNIDPEPFMFLDKDY